MEAIDYKSLAESLNPRKRLGQNFLLNPDVAKSEAEYARGKSVIEVGTGLGILTRELCRVAKRVISVEYDKRLYDILQHALNYKNLELINADFFDIPEKRLKGAEIMVANIPYNISSKTISWLAERQMPALLCMQKEFVEHMLAKPDTDKYSKLSVMMELQFKLYELMDVSPESFYPKPKVSSKVIFLKPTGRKIDKRTIEVIGLLMMHKKKKVRNALIDSSKGLSVDKDALHEIVGKISEPNARPFKLQPERLMELAAEIRKSLK